MTPVHVAWQISDVHLLRESLGGLDVDDLRFGTEAPEEAEWFVGASFVTRPAQTRAPVGRRILIVTEPNGYFPRAFTDQYGIAISPFALPDYRGAWIHGHGALPNAFASRADGPLGRLDAAQLLALRAPAKNDQVSVVVSTKSILPGHRARLRFVKALRHELGETLQVYGHGIRPIDDKAEAILPAKYHLVVENTVMPGYWTEKLADAWLGHAFPFINGPPDLERWFPPESFVRLDMDDPSAAAATIRKAIADDLYAERQPAVAEARRILLQRERLLPMMARIIAAHPNDAPQLDNPVTVTPQPRAPFLHRVRREAVRFVWQVHTKFTRDALT